MREVTSTVDASLERPTSGTMRSAKSGRGQGPNASAPRFALVVAVAALLACVFATSASAQQFTMIVDVGSTTSVGMGPGAMLSTGGGTVTFDGQPIGTFMHTTQTMTMAGMMGHMASFQQRMVTFQLPGIGTVFAMMVGGNPWSGAQGVIAGGTDQAHGISGTVTVGNEVSPNHYPFVLTLGP